MHAHCHYVGDYVNVIGLLKFHLKRLKIFVCIEYIIWYSVHLIVVCSVLLEMSYNSKLAIQPLSEQQKSIF